MPLVSLMGFPKLEKMIGLAVHNKDYGPGIQGEDTKVCTGEKEDSILNTHEILKKNAFWFSLCKVLCYQLIEGKVILHVDVLGNVPAKDWSSPGGHREKLSGGLA